VLITLAPLVGWFCRNYAVAGGWSGHRVSSSLSLLGSANLMLRTVMTWYAPRSFVEQRWFRAALVAGALVVAALLRGRTNLRPAVATTVSLVLFVCAYVGFVIMATRVDFFAIDNRMMCPIYIPVTLLGLLAIKAVAADGVRNRSWSIVSALAIATALIWLVYPIHRVIVMGTGFAREGVPGYTTLLWRGSETSRFLTSSEMNNRTPLYSNGIDAAYILADRKARWTPSRGRYAQPPENGDLSALRGQWPEETNAWLVWFDRIERPYLFTPEELSTIADIKTVHRFSDGSLYRVGKR
jgi:hypothetical protein